MEIGYARVSTAKQDLERQVEALVEAGVGRERIYLNTKSGATIDRPGLRAALAYAGPGDVIVVRTLDRLGRTARDTLKLIPSSPRPASGPQRRRPDPGRLLPPGGPDGPRLRRTHWLGGHRSRRPRRYFACMLDPVAGYLFGRLADKTLRAAGSGINDLRYQGDRAEVHEAFMVALRRAVEEAAPAELEYEWVLSAIGEHLRTGTGERVAVAPGDVAAMDDGSFGLRLKEVLPPALLLDLEALRLNTERFFRAFDNHFADGLRRAALVPSSELGPLVARYEHNRINSKVEALLRLSQQASSAGIQRLEPLSPDLLPIQAYPVAGRDKYLLKLRTLTEGAVREARAVLVTIDGMPGSGKTSLVERWAGEVASDFPGARLYSNLHGYDAAAPGSPGAVLDRFLRALGVEGEHVPTDMGQRLDLFAKLTKGRRCLVILDNARDEQQVEAILPDALEACVVITSRKRLGGLAARRQARRLPLALPNVQEATAILGARLRDWNPQDDRAEQQGAAAADLVKLCGFLPLAITITAARVADFPTTPLAQFVDELQALRGRREFYPADDAAMRLDAVFSWSYDSLSPESARLFRLLCVYPNLHSSAALSSALMDAEEPIVGRQLAALKAANLLEEPSPGRYRLHDLVRDFGAALAAAQTAESRPAIARGNAWYLAGAMSAARALAPGTRRPAGEYAARSSPTFEAQEAALAWCDEERDNILALARWASGQGDCYLAWRLAAAMQDNYYNLRKLLTDWLETHDLALACVRRHGDSIGEAWILYNLGVAWWHRKHRLRALHLLRQSLQLQRTNEDVLGEGQCWNMIGAVLLSLGHAGWAEAALHKALDLLREGRYDWGLAWALDNLGEVCRSRGEHERAVEYYVQALIVGKKAGDLYGELYKLGHMGESLRQLRRNDEALRALRESQRVARHLGDQYGEAWALHHEGLCHQESGDALEALRCFGEARALWELLGAVGSEAKALAKLLPMAQRLGRDTSALMDRSRRLMMTVGSSPMVPVEDKAPPFQ